MTEFTKPLTSFSPADQWCDYELLGVAASLLGQDPRGVHLKLRNFGSIMITTPAGGFTSLKDLSALIGYLADCLEDARLYGEPDGLFTGVRE